MRVYIGIVAKADNGSTPEFRSLITNRAQRAAERMIHRAFPSRNSLLPMETWNNERGDVCLSGWTNEPTPSNNQLIFKSAGRALGRSGYLAGGSADSVFLESDELLSATTDSGGCFSVIRADENGIQAVTDITRSGGLYWASNEFLTVVSTRALFTHLVAESVRSNSRNPQLNFDLFSIRSMASVGHFLGNFTPYSNVSAIDVSTCLRIDPWFVRTQSLPPIIEITGKEEGDKWQDTVSEMSSLLVDSYEPALGTVANLSLTGGRDSRLLAASIIKNSEIEMSAATNGIPGHPDVDLAVEISSRLNISHKVISPIGLENDSTLHVEDPLERIIRCLDVHDGMTSGWDDIGDYGPMSMKPTISGVGGEILRGGMVVPHLDSFDNGQAVQIIKTAMAGAPNIFNPEWMRQSVAFAGPMLELAARDPYTASDRYYHVHRNGRWVSARRSGSRFRAFAVDPLLDNRLVRKALSISPETRWSERLVFDMVAHLAPDIRDIPIEGARWRFERHAPDVLGTANEQAAWSMRAGIVAPPRIGGYHWPALKHEGMRNKLRDLIMDRMVGDVATLFDRQGIEDMFAAGPPRWPATVWGVATTAVLLSDEWHDSSRPEKKLSITIDPRENS